MELSSGVKSKANLFTTHTDIYKTDTIELKKVIFYKSIPKYNNSVSCTCLTLRGQFSHWTFFLNRRIFTTAIIQIRIHLRIIKVVIGKFNRCMF